MYCEQAEMKLAQYLFDEMSEAERIELEAHLDACDACHEKVGDMRITVGLLKDGIVAEPSPVMSESKRSALMAQLSQPAADSEPELPSHDDARSFNWSFPITPQGRAMLTAAGLVFAVLLTGILMPNADQVSERSSQYSVKFGNSSYKDGATKDGHDYGRTSDETWLDESVMTDSYSFKPQSNLNGAYLRLPDSDATPSSPTTIARVDPRTTTYDTPLPAAADMPAVRATFAHEGEESKSADRSLGLESSKRMALLDDSKSTNGALPERYRNSTNNFYRNYGRDDNALAAPIKAVPGESRFKDIDGNGAIDEQSIRELAQLSASDNQKPGTLKFQSAIANNGSTYSTGQGRPASGEPLSDDLQTDASRRWDADESRTSKSETIGGTAGRPGYESFNRSGPTADKDKLSVVDGIEQRFGKRPANDPTDLSPKFAPTTGNAPTKPAPRGPTPKDSVPDNQDDFRGSRMARGGRVGDDGGFNTTKSRFDNLKENPQASSRPGGEADFKSPRTPGHWAYTPPPTTTTASDIDRMVRKKLHAPGEKDAEAPVDGTAPVAGPALPGSNRQYGLSEETARNRPYEGSWEGRRTVSGGTIAPEQHQFSGQGKEASDLFGDQSGEGFGPGQGQGNGQAGKSGQELNWKLTKNSTGNAMQSGKQRELDVNDEMRLSGKPLTQDWSTFRGDHDLSGPKSKPDSSPEPRSRRFEEGFINRPELLAKLDSINRNGGEDKKLTARIDDYEHAFRMQQPNGRSGEVTRDKYSTATATEFESRLAKPGDYGLGAEDGRREVEKKGEGQGFQKSREKLDGESLFDQSEYLDTTARTRIAIKELQTQNEQLQIALEQQVEARGLNAVDPEATKGDKQSLEFGGKLIELEAKNNALNGASKELREQLERNQETILSLSSRLEEGKPAKTLFAVPNPEVQIRAHVTNTQKASNDVTLAQINIGAVAGVKAGQEFSIHRDGKYLDTLTVTRVDQQVATGTLKNQNQSVQAGDGAIISAITLGGKHNNGQRGEDKSRQLEEAETEDDSPLPPSSNFTVGPVNPWTRTEIDKQSTFALDVDTASYTLARKYIRKGYLPPAGAVRMEEFVNAFDYNYPEKTGQTFTVFASGAPAPFAPANQHNVKLLKVGVRGKVIGRDKLKPAHVVFVVDTSGSMARQDRLPLVKYSLTQLVQQLHQGGEGRPADRVSLVSYGSDVHVLLDRAPASQANQIVSAIDSLQPTGATNLLKGVSTGYRVAQQAFKAGQINRIILCSDGIATLGETEADAMLEHVDHYRKQGISFTSVGFGAGTYNDSLMEKLANKGDGTYIYVDSQREARRVFADELTSTLQMIAKDAKIQVEFNPHRVHRYRLIGYENRAIADKDFRNDTIDAGEVGSGQSSTALYEVELHGDASASIGTVFVRYKNIDTDNVEEISYALSNDMIDDRTPSNNPRFFLAASAAEFAEILRQSEHARDGNLDQLEFTMHQVVQQLPLDQKAKELLTLIRKARTLPRAP